MECIIKCASTLQLIIILVYIMICKVYGVQDPCPPLSCLSNSLYVRLGDLKSELQQTITDQAEVIKNQTDIITQLRAELQSQVMLRVVLNNHVCQV